MPEKEWERMGPIKLPRSFTLARASLIGMPPRGRSESRGRISTGPGTASRSVYRWSTIATTIAISIIAKSLPMHWCGPPRNGKNANFGRAAACSGEKRSGSKRSTGASQRPGWRWVTYWLRMMIDPAGMTVPADLVGLDGVAHQGEDRRVEPHRLVDHLSRVAEVRDIRGGGRPARQDLFDFLPHPPLDLRVAREQVEGPGERDGRRLVAGADEGDDLVAQLDVAEGLAGFLVAGQHEHGEQVAAVQVAVCHITAVGAASPLPAPRRSLMMP